MWESVQRVVQLIEAQTHSRDQRAVLVPGAWMQQELPSTRPASPPHETAPGGGQEDEGRDYFRNR